MAEIEQGAGSIEYDQNSSNNFTSPPAHLFLRWPNLRSANPVAELFVGIRSENPWATLQLLTSQKANFGNGEILTINDSIGRSRQSILDAEQETEPKAEDQKTQFQDSKTQSENQDERTEVVSEPYSESITTRGMLEQVKTIASEHFDKVKMQLLNTSNMYIYMSVQPNGKLVFTNHHGDKILNFTAKSLKNEIVHPFLEALVNVKAQGLDGRLREIYDSAIKTSIEHAQPGEFEAFVSSR